MNIDFYGMKKKMYLMKHGKKKFLLFLYSNQIFLLGKNVWRKNIMINYLKNIVYAISAIGKRKKLLCDGVLTKRLSVVKVNSYMTYDCNRKKPFWRYDYFIRLFTRAANGPSIQYE